MKQRSTLVLLTLVFITILSSTSMGQVVGKIFNKDEANTRFGGVIESVKLNVAELRTIISKTDKYVMFKIVKGEATILGDGRKAIYPSIDTAVGAEDVYHICSKSKVLELLDNNSGDFIFLESRQTVYSITYGNSTLEEMLLCPPFCPET